MLQLCGHLLMKINWRQVKLEGKFFLILTLTYT